MLALMRKLPDDAVVTRVDYDNTTDCSILVVWSATFEPIGENMRLPYYTLSGSRDDAEAEKSGTLLRPGEKVARPVGASPALGAPYGGAARCTCDLAYTGARSHNRDCPARS